MTSVLGVSLLLVKGTEQAFLSFCLSRLAHILDYLPQYSAQHRDDSIALLLATTATIVHDLRAWAYCIPEALKQEVRHVRDTLVSHSNNLPEHCLISTVFEAYLMATEQQVVKRLPRACPRLC